MQALIIKDGALSSAEASAYIGYAHGTLKNWRCMGEPNQPPYIKPKGRILYMIADLDKWLENKNE